MPREEESMPDAIRTAPMRPWPGGRSKTIAVLRWPPEEIADQAGVTFETGIDDLDYWQALAIETGSVGQLWLWRYLRNPFPGTEVLADLSVTVRDALAATLATLRISASDFTWTAALDGDTESDESSRGTGSG
jgi:hypothetical protein